MILLDNYSTFTDSDRGVSINQLNCHAKQNQKPVSCRIKKNKS